MDMNEKRYFSIYSKKHVIGKRNKYDVIFGILQQLKEYDEIQLIKEVRKQGFDARYIKADQNYLYQLILRALREYHTGKTANLRVKEFLIDIEILQAKGMFSSCLKTISNALELCLEFELFDLGMQVLYWERKIALLGVAGSRKEQQILADMDHMNAMQANLIEFTEMHEQAGKLRQRAVAVRNKEAVDALKDFLNQLQLQDIKSAKSVNAQIRFYQIHAIRNNVTGDKAGELEMNKRIIALMDSKGPFSLEYPLDYVSIRSRILAITKDLHPKRFNDELESFIAIEAPQGHISASRVKAQVFNFSCMMQMSMLIGKSDFKQAIALFQEVESGYEKYEAMLPETSKITLLYMLSYIAYAEGNLKSARKKVNALLNNFDKSVRPEIWNFARLLNVLIHFDERNSDYIKSEVSSIAYYFRKQGLTYRTESEVLKFLMRTQKLHKVTQEEWKKLAFRLESLQKEGLESKANTFFDFRLWLKAKIAKRTMAESGR
jgi:anion-transporting  ArsA/GET3 family ATPase